MTDDEGAGDPVFMIPLIFFFFFEAALELGFLNNDADLSATCGPIFLVYLLLSPTDYLLRPTGFSTL